MPIPDLATGEVLIRVLRAGLNHGDLHMREDAVQYSPEVKTVPDLPMTIGHDGLGEVVEVGPDVESVRVGDRVVVICSITCGSCKYCRTERQHLCQTKKTMGFLTKFGEGPAYLRRYKDGLWAEYCRVPACNVVRLPRDADINEMCKVSQINVGYRALKRARLHSGEIVLVNGASGAVGAAAVQLAKHFGAEVTAVCSTANVELVQSLGADTVIDYTKEDFTNTGQTYDIIFDAVGKSSFSRCRSSLTPSGVYLTTVPSLAIYPQTLWTSKLGRKRAIIAAAGLRRSSEKTKGLVFLKALIEAGKITPVIDRSYPLKQTADAHRYVDKGHKKGNVVITVAQNDNG